MLFLYSKRLHEQKNITMVNSVTNTWSIQQTPMFHGCTITNKQNVEPWKFRRHGATPRFYLHVDFIKNALGILYGIISNVIEYLIKYQLIRVPWRLFHIHCMLMNLLYSTTDVWINSYPKKDFFNYI
jgi:hypothetical protein